MKITKRQLRRIIKEEWVKLNENEISKQPSARGIANAILQLNREAYNEKMTEDDLDYILKEAEKMVRQELRWVEGSIRTYSKEKCLEEKKKGAQLKWVENSDGTGVCASSRYDNQLPFKKGQNKYGPGGKQERWNE